MLTQVHHVVLKQHSHDFPSSEWNQQFVVCLHRRLQSSNDPIQLESQQFWWWARPAIFSFDALFFFAMTLLKSTTRWLVRFPSNRKLNWQAFHNSGNGTSAFHRGLTNHYSLNAVSFAQGETTRGHVVKRETEASTSNHLLTKLR